MLNDLESIKEVPLYSIVDVLLKDRQSHYFKFFPKQQTCADKINIWTPKDTKQTYIYGGAMGGGKTYLFLALFIELAILYPGSKWTIMRETLQRCKETIIPDFKRMAGKLYKKFYESGQTGQVAIFPNGSTIEFKGENKQQDKDLDAFKSYQTNGFFLEQLEELSEDMYEMALIRTGRWRVDPMPPQIVVASVNPSANWVKDRFYLPHMKDNLPETITYIPALITDNPVLSEDETYMSGFENLDKLTLARYLKGDWDAFAAKSPFAHAFNQNIHTVNKTIEVDEEYPLYLSFDFNHDPVTCTLWQHYEERIYGIREFSSTNGLGELCDNIKDCIGWDEESQALAWNCFVTGDRSGWSRSELLDGNRTAYDIIQQKLGLTQYQIDTPKTNPNLLKSRELVNGILEHYPEFIISSSQCPNLIFDLKYVEADDKHQIIKDRNKTQGKADFLDTMRYYLNTYHQDFIRL